MTNFIYLLSIPRLLNDLRTQQNSLSKLTFLTQTNYKIIHKRILTTLLAVAIKYYQPQHNS